MSKLPKLPKVVIEQSRTLAGWKRVILGDLVLGKVYGQGIRGPAFRKDYQRTWFFVPEKEFRYLRHITADTEGEIRDELAHRLRVRIACRLKPSR